MEINLYLRTLRRGWWIVLLTMLVAMNASLLFSYLTPPVYEATARFVVSPNAGMYDSSWDVVSSLDTLDRRSIINTYKELLSSPSVYEENTDIQQLGVDEISDNYMISVVVIPDTNILRLNVTGPDPEKVLALTNAVSDQALVYINELYPVYNFSIFDEAKLNREPIHPLPMQNAGLALIMGGILGLSLAFSREQLQNTFESLRERSIVDSVSAAYTKKYYMRRLREEIAQDDSASLSLGLIHLRGLDDVSGALPQILFDRVLRGVTRILINELRGRDIVARWDNTKLAILLPNTTGTAVEKTFKRIQSYLAEAIPVSESKDMLISPDPCIGIAERAQFESSDEVIERVEAAVERAASFKKAAVVFLSAPFVFDDKKK